MKKNCILNLGFVLSLLGANAQTSYSVKQSVELEPVKGHDVISTFAYGNNIIQTSALHVKAFTFRQFSPDLTITKEKTVVTEGKLDEALVKVERVFKFKNKTYLFAREVNKAAKTEGITAWEFSPDKLDFVGEPKNLFQSTFKVDYTFPGRGGIMYTMEPTLRFRQEGYNFLVSADQSKFLYTYFLSPKERGNAQFKTTVGLNVFDENLVKQWGGEYEMPYPETNIGYISYALANDGKAYLLVKVYDEETNEEKGKDPLHHFEIFVYQKGSTKPDIIKIEKDNHFLIGEHSRIFEAKNGVMMIAGVYSNQAAQKIVQNFLYGKKDPMAGGVYLFKLDVPNKKISKGSGYYANTTGADNLTLKKILVMENGSIKIITEINYFESIERYDPSSKKYTTQNDFYSLAAEVISIGEKGNLEWAASIPKQQHGWDCKYSEEYSLNTFVKDNDIYVYYLDSKGKSDFLNAVHIDPSGKTTKSVLGSTEKYNSDLKIRYFVDGGSNGLIGSTELKRNKTILYSIQVK